MDLLYRNATPSYRGMNAQPQAPSGLFAGLLGNLLGGNVPSYRTVDGRRASAASSASWWQALTLTKKPSYKTAPSITEPAAQASEVVLRCDAPVDDTGEPDADTTCACAPEGATQIVILDE